MQDATDLRASCKIGHIVKLSYAVSLREYRSVLANLAGYLACEMTKDSRLRGRASSEACDTASCGPGTLNMFACMAITGSPSFFDCRIILCKRSGIETCAF